MIDPELHGQQHEPRCLFCGRRAIRSEVPESGAHDVDCAICGRYRASQDREVRFLQKQFSRRARAQHLRGIRAANDEGFRYSIDDGRAIG